MTNLHREYIGHQVTETQGVREEGAEGDTVSTVYTRANHLVRNPPNLEHLVRVVDFGNYRDARVNTPCIPYSTLQAASTAKAHAH